MSKELEALEMIVVDLVPKAKEHNKEEIEIIKKSLKAFEIIKNKRVNVFDLLRHLRYEDYNEYSTLYKEQELTEEEFNILKEVLK